MSDLVWASALSPKEPFIPRARHWSAGIAAMVILTVAASSWYASLDHTVEAPVEIVEERVVVALGAAAPKRIEAPPPASMNAPATDAPYIAAERAKDAPPIAPPPEARPVAQWSQGTGGDFSSGTGGSAPEPLPPPPPPKAEPAKPVAIGGEFARAATIRYSSLVEYPSASLRQEEEGVGILSVIVRPNGQVVKWWLEKSTGWSRLDKEIERVARKVKRLDALPAGYPGNVRVVVPIRFRIEDQ